MSFRKSDTKFRSLKFCGEIDYVGFQSSSTLLNPSCWRELLKQYVAAMKDVFPFIFQVVPLICNHTNVLPITVFSLKSIIGGITCQCSGSSFPLMSIAAIRELLWTNFRSWLAPHVCLNASVEAYWSWVSLTTMSIDSCFKKRRVNSYIHPYFPHCFIWTHVGLLNEKENIQIAFKIVILSAIEHA